MLKKFAVLLAVACASPAIAQTGPVVKIETGTLRGTTERGLQIFRGIPYAAPPVGELRWRAPKRAAAWSGTRDARGYGAACPQPGDHKEAWARVGPTSEDCLFLNVWRPASKGRYPVMVFLHGGGFTYGSAGVPLYEGSNLARRGVVLVSLNYRLGRLGHFAHPALTREAPDAPLGNYGVMDQVAALQWVQRNIAAFGGDPGNVTVFGESAGAGIVQTLMGSPAGQGLFHRAISQSGAGGSVLAPIRGTPESAEVAGARWAESIGLPNATAAQLRAVPVDKTIGRAFPFIDGKVIVASPGTAFFRGRQMKVPLMIGANSNEATLRNNNEQVARWVLGARYGAFLDRYAAARAGNRAAAQVDLAEDALSILPSASIAALHAAHGGAAFNFYFDMVPANLRRGSAGSPHGGELEYLFGNPDEGSQWDQADHATSDQMARYWVQFARAGDPNQRGLPRWPRVAATGAVDLLVLRKAPEPSRLSELEEAVRKVSLDASAARWAAEP